MKCNPTGSPEEPSYGYVKKNCDYEPKEECQTVSSLTQLRIMYMHYRVLLNYNQYNISDVIVLLFF